MRRGSNACLVLRKGAWTADEDMLLKNCIEKYGEGKWHLVPLKTGLRRCRKSCRLRWLNYLSPNIKRGYFREDEVDLIRRLHKLLGNRWSLIAGRIPGRTANDVKNYWNTHLCPRPKKQKKEPNADHEPLQDAEVTIVIKPQPRTFAKSQICYISDNPQIADHGGVNLISSSNDGANNINVSSGLISSPSLPDDMINEYIGELLNDRELQTCEKVGYSFGDALAKGEALNDDNSSLFDFPMDDVMWDLMAVEN